MSTQENYSINAAAKLTGYSIPTIRKRLPALEDLGAVQIEGSWQIPLSALHAVGLMVKVEGDAVFSKGPADTVATLRARVDYLEKALADAEKETPELKIRAAVAEAVANERGDALADMRNAARQLEGRGPRRFKLFS